MNTHVLDNETLTKMCNRLSEVLDVCQQMSGVHPKKLKLDAAIESVICEFHMMGYMTPDGLYTLYHHGEEVVRNLAKRKEVA